MSSTAISSNDTLRSKKYSFRSDDSLFWSKPEFVVLKTIDSPKKEEKATWISERFVLNIVGKIFILDRSLVNIKDVVVTSQNILNLKDDWDDEGALATDELTFGRAIDILINYAKDVSNVYNFIISAPEINLGKDGSIDLEWRSENYILLLNIQKSKELNIHYYGEDYKTKTIIKGFIEDFSINKDLSFWMQKLV